MTALPGRPGVPFGRTLHAELRKMVDTRAGRWMVIVMAASPPSSCSPPSSSGARPRTPRSRGLLELVDAAPRDAAAGPGHHGRDRRVDASAPAWSPSPSSRTAAGSCSPRRSPRSSSRSSCSPRPWPPPPWPTSSAAPASGTSPPRPAGGLVLALLIYVLQGVAFGLLFLNTPVAIVSVLVLPTVWSIATTAISAAAGRRRVAQPRLGHHAAVRRRDGRPGLGAARHRASRCGCCCRWRSAPTGCSTAR